MKKIFKMMFAVVAGVAALTACTNEPEEGVTPTPEVEGFTVVASMDDATKAALVDGESIKWENNDKVTAWYVDAEGNFGYAMREEAEAAVSEDGYTATLNYTTIPVGSTLWLAYGSNTGYDGCSAGKVEFNYNSNQTQAEAGTMNKEYLRLVGEETNVTEGEGEYTAKMKIVGTIMRYIIYSSNGTYATESVKKVELVSTDNALAGSGAAIAYNFAEYKDTEKGYKYHSTNGFSDECTIFWDATSKSITTTLTTPMALSATDAASSKGIYMTVPAVSVGGYKYVVTTDKAIYTFDASTTAVKFNDNVVKNVLLDVENEKVTRVDLSAIKGELQYTGDLNAASGLLSYEGVTDKDGGYWYAQTRDTGAGWVNKEGADNAHYYTGVTFECIDNATGEAADWLTVSYRTDGTTHWWITAQPNESEEQRSATVTATFPDVDGYIVTEACKTKVITVTQQGFSLIKTLGFYGGIGDQTISAEGVDKQSLGYCVITVNSTNAESWADDKNNEQELYGNVVIECREGAANGPIVDWLTVEYGKDAEGKFNSTHLLATATANNTGAMRKALVCCTYNAPEGYEFEGGAKSFFRQFFVSQPAQGALKVVEFWGGIGEHSHNANAQQNWGLSWWVIKVDGADATDWNGDSHKEQLLYGSAEFKCYDYTNGVRGEEIDWVSVYYRHNSDGKVTDTWWDADIQENTGAARAAEIVCTWPEIEGYTYKDGQNVKTAIIRQDGVTTGGDDNTEEPAVPGEDVYTYKVDPAGPAWGSGWGFPANTVHDGNYAFIRDATKNGETLYFDGVNVVDNPGEVAAQLVAMAFVSSAPTDEEKAAFGMQGKIASATAITARARWYGGVQIDVAFTTTDANSITKVTGYAGDGTELGYWIIWTD